MSINPRLFWNFLRSVRACHDSRGSLVHTSTSSQQGRAFRYMDIRNLPGTHFHLLFDNKASSHEVLAGFLLHIVGQTNGVIFRPAARFCTSFRYLYYLSRSLLLYKYSTSIIVPLAP
jgi:hypothetical protein